jgi:hypothetical protein
MGYGVDAEYTIEILAEPQAYEFVGQKFYCSGFLLASDLHEQVIETILTRWRQIETVTSNRIRFLFFVDNKSHLSGWPARPSFTESGYLKHNTGLVRAADAAGFQLKVRPGAQNYNGPSSRRGAARAHPPEERVRKLA